MPGGRPQTKGKDESANRFLNRLSAYDRDFVGLDWIGNTYLDDSGRDSPASLNSTGDM